MRFQAAFRSLCLAALVATTPSFAQAQTLVGLIFDETSAVPVAGARLTLLDGDVVVRSTLSDAAGSFILLAPRAGEYQVRVSRLGYATYLSDRIQLSSQSTTQVRLQLGVDAIPLDPITVLAESRPRTGPLIGFEERMADPSLSGHFVTAEEIRRRPIATPTQLISGLPGVLIQRIQTADDPIGTNRGMIYLPGARGGTTRPGSCIAQVYVNGSHVRQTEDFSIDDLLNGPDLAGVEVYPRASSAPMQFQGTGECGVVLFWLAEPEISNKDWGLKRILAGAGLILGLVFLGFRN